MSPTDSVSLLAAHAPLWRYHRREGRAAFVRGMFDRTACDYDRIERVMALGHGSWYRRQALLRAGLRPGMRVLDVAVGTGLVAREAAAVVGEPRAVVGIDPSEGMLIEAKRRVALPVIRGTGEALPLEDASFDFLSMGYALRHLTDVSSALHEFRRVLRPGGILCLLEITPPRGRIAMALARIYMRAVVPLLARFAATRADTQLLWRYYWDTIEACVPPERFLEAMTDAGFVDVRRNVELGVFSEYTGRKA